MADTADPNATPPGPAAPPPPAPDPADGPQMLPIVNVVRRNRIPANAAVLGQNNLINVRQRLFHEIYFKVAIMYAQFIPPYMRRAFEYFILFKALIFFAALVYLHSAFIKNPATCLQHIKDWPRDGVLRVEVIPNLEQKRAAMERTKAFEKLTMALQKNYYFGIGPQTKENDYVWRSYEKILNKVGYGMQRTLVNKNETVLYYYKMDAKSSEIERIPPNALLLPPVLNEPPLDNDDDEQYIVEYSLEYGHLRLSAATRKRLQIPVRVVQLDPMKDKCFGDTFSKFMLRKVLGYDDLLMASVRVIAEQEDNKGYLRNVITGEHYRFVSMWWAAWSSYPTAFSVMLLFTFSISMLLRFSHHQIFVFIVDLLQMLEFNITARFPIAPLLTVILALVGMEAIMSEFFNDATTAFYIILLVWIADQYDAICCHTTITKRHWLRFFYLYHFAFYAYHHRFSGQNRNLSLITSWLFIQHSMVFFFHRFELPVIVQQAQIIFLTRNQPNAAAAAATAAGAGVGAGAGAGGGGGAGDGGRANADAGTGGGGINDGEGAADGQHQQQPLRQGIFLLRQPPIRIFPVRNRPINWESIQRAILQRGWRANLPVRVQIGNVHGINVNSVQQNAVRLAAAAAAAQIAHHATHNVDTSDATNDSATTATATATTPITTTTTSTNTSPCRSFASIRNAAGAIRTIAANSSETDIESNEETTAPAKPSPTTVIEAGLGSSEGHRVKPAQNVHHLKASTGNNHIECAENIENNKTESEEDLAEQEKQVDCVYGEIMETKYDDKILKTAATTAEEENQKPGRAEGTEIPTPSTAPRSSDGTTSKSGNKNEGGDNNRNTNLNEQLEDDLYGIVKGNPKANATESKQEPQESFTKKASFIAAAEPAAKLMMAIAAADDLKPQEVDQKEEIVRKGLTENTAAAELQAINQKNIENSELLSNADHIVATTSISIPIPIPIQTPTSTSIPLKRDENFDMIDSAECRHLTQAGGKTCCNLCSNIVGNKNNSDIELAKDSSTQSPPAAAAALELAADRTDLSLRGKSVDLLPTNRSSVRDCEHQQQQLSTANFIANEAAYSSEF